LNLDRNRLFHRVVIVFTYTRPLAAVTMSWAISSNVPRLWIAAIATPGCPAVRAMEENLVTLVITV
jgi:hypothetical protein